MTTQENPLGSVFPETGGELSQEEQNKRDEAIMANLRARRAAEAAAEDAAKPVEDAAIDAARRALEDSEAWDTPEAQRRGFN